MPSSGFTFKAALACSVALFALPPSHSLEVAFSVNGAYSIPNHAGYGAAGFAPPDYGVMPARPSVPASRDLGNGWGAADVKAAVSCAGETDFAGRLRGKFTAELSPVSVNGIAQASYVPIPFAAFEAGAGVGTGWTVGPVGGLGVNPEDPAAAAIELTPFGGAVCRQWGGVTLQFDYAAIHPGPWRHIIAKTTLKTEYRRNTSATGNEAWLWEADAGENFNGTRLIGTAFLGYQMPRKCNLVGFSAETTEWLGGIRALSPMSREGGWGSDFRSVRLGLVTGFRIGVRDSLVLVAQVKRSPDFTDGTVRLRDFRRRDYDGPYWSLNRIIASYTHAF